MNNAELDHHLYKYPDSDILKNKLNIHDKATLDLVEQELVTNRIIQGSPKGDFDLQHLQSIHKHLFQDVYGWAGDIRQVHIHKGGQPFLPPDRIRFAMQDVHKRVKEQNNLSGLDRQQFAKEAGQIIGDVNYIHPFREGNGRTQFQYLEQLGETAGHKIDLSRFNREEWIYASIKANEAEYHYMSECISKAVGEQTQEKTERERKKEVFKAQERLRRQQERERREQNFDRDGYDF